MGHGGRLLVDQLALLGVPRVFHVPGESFLAVLDALHDDNRIQGIVCRHEAGAAMMAEATARLTGVPGVALVSRGPGAANAIPALLIAAEDETPMVLVAGLPSRAIERWEAFQRIEVDKFFAGCTKAIFHAREPAALGEVTRQAFAASLSGRPGPVVLAIPEDVLSARTDAQALAPIAHPRASVSTSDLEAFARIIEASERPLIVVGGPGWSEEARHHLEAFALRFDLPVAAAFRQQDHFDNGHRCYAGHMGFPYEAKLASGVKAADLLISIGGRLGDFSTKSFTLVEMPEPKQRLVRVHPSADVIAEGPRTDLGIVADLADFVRATRAIEPRSNRPWATFRRDLRAAYEASLVPAETPGDVRMEQVVAHIASVMPEGAIVTNGAGNYAQFVHRYYQFNSFGTSLAPAYGTMGYGLPAAIAAKLERPDTPVVAFAGDGCFLMTSPELATAVQYGLPLIVVVADNGMYGTIRMHQERQYPGRVSGTTLVNPDFARMAESFGAFGAEITRQEEFAPAFAAAMASGKPAVLHLRLDPEAITPGQTLSSLR